MLTRLFRAATGLRVIYGLDAGGGRRMSGAPDHRQARLHDRRRSAATLRRGRGHVAGCAACRRFRDETLSLDGRLRAALELPLAAFRRRGAAPVRRFALAASVVLALLVAGGAWLFRPPSALAGEVVAHVEEEAGSWSASRRCRRDAIGGVLAAAGVEFDAPLPVVYAAPCVSADGTSRISWSRPRTVR